MKTLYIVSAKVVDNLSVLLYFNDNTRQVVDIGSYIHNHPHPQYNKYLNPRQFAKFKIENGNIVWGDDWDLIFPIEELHRGCIDEPNETTLTAMKDAEEGHTYKDANSVKELMNYLKQ